MIAPFVAMLVSPLFLIIGVECYLAFARSRKQDRSDMEAQTRGLRREMGVLQDRIYDLRTQISDLKSEAEAYKAQYYHAAKEVRELRSMMKGAVEFQRGSSETKPRN